VLSAAPAAAAPLASFSGTCHSNVRVFLTNMGNDTVVGPITIARDVGVAGVATLTLPDGTELTGPVSGRQKVVANAMTQTAEVIGRVSGSAAGGNLTMGYTAHLDLSTGKFTGEMHVLESSGALAGFFFNGRAEGHLVGPLGAEGSSSGPCHLGI
jgi:hypothetical protein